MGGISRLSAMIMSTRDDLIIDAVQDKETKKFIGIITFGEADRYRLLVDSQPVFNSAKEAKEAMQKLISDCKKAITKETGGKDPVSHYVGLAGASSEAAALVKKVVSMSKEKPS